MPQQIKADLDEMVFENRERRYGGYYLRKQYRRSLLVGMIVVSSVFVLASAAPLIAKYLAPEEEIIEDTDRNVVVVDLDELPPPPPIEEDEPPPPPPPEVNIEPPKRATVAFKMPEPVPEEELPEEPEEEMATVDEVEESNPGLVTQEGTDDGFLEGLDDGPGEVAVVVAEPEPKNTEPDINQIIIGAKEPEPVNLENIQKAIGYPDIARENGIEGMVVVRVLVDKKGNYKKHKVIKSANPLLAQACEKKINQLRFTPALQGGKPIQFWVNVPFRFKLAE